MTEPGVREVVLHRAGSPAHAWVHGHEGGPLVVCTHGATMDGRMFDAQVGPLVAAGYQVLTWDLRGHGPPEAFTRLLLAFLAEHLPVLGR
ncbi:alpha/beta fold hydrolase [Pseudokineococcus sp. 1T1Z-3]|uniref:alpha/beta fold hydrolase n=1 Tax=Pseudokineococcus sp. 1T1Z-3 TaxID=3132745 RepID=UPI0030A1AF24